MSKRNLIGLLMLAAAVSAGGAPLGFNAGLDIEVTGDDGLFYQADTAYTDGQDGGYLGGTPTPRTPVALFHDGSAEEDFLYFGQRSGVHTYRFRTEPGIYELTLRFAELFANGPEARIQQISVNGRVIIDSLDVHALVGKERSVDVRRGVALADTLTDVQITAINGEPMLAAIALRPVTGDPGLLPRLQNLQVRPTFGGALLTWDPGPSKYRDGYGVGIKNHLGKLIHRERRWASWAVVPSNPNYEIYLLPIRADGQYGLILKANGVLPLDRDESNVRDFDLVVDPVDLRRLEADLPAKTRVPAQFFEDGILRLGTVNHRGSNSLEAPKKSWKFRIQAGDPIDDSRVVALAGEFADGAFIREIVARDMMVGAGHPSYEVEFARLFLNHEYAGVFSKIEEPDEDYLSRIGLDSNGRCYSVEQELNPKSSWDAYARTFENTNFNDRERRDAIELVQELNTVPEEEVEFWIRQNFDVDWFCIWLATQNYAANKDYMTHNYLLHRDRNGGLWRPLAWDVDQIFRDVHASPLAGDRDHPNNVGKFNRIVDRFLASPSLRRRYLVRLFNLLAGPLNHATMAAYHQTRRAEVAADLELDVYKRQREHWDTIFDEWATLGNYYKAREAALRDSIAVLTPPKWVALSLNELSVVYDTLGTALVDSIELHYRGIQALSLDGYFLSDNPETLDKWALPQSTLGEDEILAIEAPEGPSPSTWWALSVDEGSGPMVIDSLVFTSPPTEASYGRYPDGYGFPRPLPAASPGAPNPWLEPIEVSARVLLSTLSRGDSVFANLEVDGRWRHHIDVDVDVEIRQRDGMWLPDPSVHTIVPPTFHGATGGVWFHPFGLETPTSLKPGRYELTFTAYESITGQELAQTHAPFFIRGNPAGPLVINEFCADNESTIADEEGQFEDWIELLNTTESDYLLDDLYLTDDLRDEPFRWPIPRTVLAPGQRLIIWADQDPKDGPYHANFKLSQSGDEIALVHNLGGAPDTLDFFEFGYQEEDRSQGRFPDGEVSWERFDFATPDAPNSSPPS